MTLSLCGTCVICSQVSDQNTTVPSLFLREEELRRGLDLIFFASRDIQVSLDQQLKSYDLGPAHFRALYFIARTPGLSVSDLLGHLQITNQSANRVLSHLHDEGYIENKVDDGDRRKRNLFATDKGLSLKSKIENRLLEDMAKAYRQAGPKSVGGFWAVLEAFIRS